MSVFEFSPSMMKRIGRCEEIAVIVENDIANHAQPSRLLYAEIEAHAVCLRAQISSQIIVSSVLKH